MQDEIDHIHFRGRLLSSGVEGRFILAVPGQSSVLEAMNTDVVSFKKLEGEEADMVEVVMPRNAIVRTVQFCKTEEVANMTWSYGPRSGGYGGAAAWKDAGYWGQPAAWKEADYWGAAAAWKEVGYWGRPAAWKEADYWGAAAWKDAGYWGRSAMW
jgi:hypothetical protein